MRPQRTTGGAERTQYATSPPAPTFRAVADDSQALAAYLWRVHADANGTNPATVRGDHQIIARPTTIHVGA